MSASQIRWSLDDGVNEFLPIMQSDVINKAAQYGERPHHVSGMLLYAGTEEAIQPNQQYMMSGNAISVRTLDLNCEFSGIEAQLKRIVAEHFYTTTSKPRERTIKNDA